MLAEHVEGVDDGVGIAEETVDAALLGGIDMAEAVGGNLLILLLQGFRDDDVLHSVLARVLIGLLSKHIVLQDGRPHLKGGVDTDAVVAIKHLGIHAAHGRADDEVGVLAVGETVQEVHSLSRMNG